jgi:NitT/TauT family transport system permease protein
MTVDQLPADLDGFTDSGHSAVYDLFHNRTFVRLLSLTVVFLSWELYGRTNSLYTSYPTEIIAAGIDTMVDSVLPAFRATAAGFSVGFIISAPLGIIFGIILGRVRSLDIALTPFMMALYSTPRITLIPLLVLWLGVDFKLRVAIVILSSIFPIIINMHAGIREVDNELIDVGRAFTASRRQELWTIVIPGSLPFLFTGLRIGLARALGGVVTAELTAAVVGIGRLILDSARFLRLDDMFVPLIILGMMSIALTALLERVRKLVMPWERREVTP